MLAGVAIGVRKEAAAATVTPISSGRTETWVSAAAEMATGMMISAVAVLLINCPTTTVNTNSPMSRAYGPLSPTALTSAMAILPAAPVFSIAVESGIIPPISTIVVQEIAW